MTKWVDVQAVATAFWTQANIANPVDFTVIIKEVSITGNMPIAEMHKRRLHWKTEDDGKYNRKLHN